jgi:hypothetical protein
VSPYGNTESVYFLLFHKPVKYSDHQLKSYGMKKLQYNYLPADGNSTARPAKAKATAKAQAKSTAPAPPDEETINRLNAIAQEYPFCVYFKQGGTSLL